MAKPKPRAYSYLRFSSPEQRLGDSERRQIEAARRYAERHDLDLSNETFKDLPSATCGGIHRCAAAGSPVGYSRFRITTLVRDGRAA